MRLVKRQATRQRVKALPQTKPRTVARKQPRKYTGPTQHFHNFEHDKNGRNHCTGPKSNPYKIDHYKGKNIITHKFAKGHGRGGKTQWFEFTRKLGNGYDMASGVKVDKPNKRQVKQRWGMIVYPDNWETVGQPISIKDVEKAILNAVEETRCASLSFSGGLDSSLILYFMLKIYGNVDVFTIAKSNSHLDLKYSKKVVEFFGRSVRHFICIPEDVDVELEKRDDDCMGDDAVRLLYKFIKKYTDSIIACDGIDEFACGYYAHASSPTEGTYYDFLNRLRDEHLVPLNNHSGDVKVYLPYLNRDLITLLSQIPIEQKVNGVDRKKILTQMAYGKIPEEIINRRKIGFCQALSGRLPW